MTDMRYQFCFSHALKMIGFKNPHIKGFGKNQSKKLELVAKAIVKVGLALNARKLSLVIKPHHDIPKQADEIVVTYYDAKDQKIKWYDLGILGTVFALRVFQTGLQLEWFIDYFAENTRSYFVPKTRKLVIRGEAFISEEGKHFRLKYWAMPTKHKIMLWLIPARNPAKIIDLSELNQ